MIKKNFDVIIVGSGAGGATLAYELSKKMKVLVIEKGLIVNPQHLGSFWHAVPRYYDKFGLSRSREGTLIYRTLNVGGTTVVSFGNLIKSLEKEFLNLGIDLRDIFIEAEKEAGVTLSADNKIVNGSKIIMEVAQRLGYQMHPMPKAYYPSTDCDLCGNCFLGCHKFTKWDARFYINQALENGANLIVDTEVKRILLSGDQVIGVETKNSNDIKEIESSMVILAAGGLGTPVILQKSDISAGRGLFIDAFEVTYGITRNLSQLRGSPMSVVDTEFLDSHGFILSSFIDHWSQMPIFCGLQWTLIHKFPRPKTFGIMTKIVDERSGRVELNGKISKSLTKQDRFKFQEGAEISREILLEVDINPTTIITTNKRARGAHPGGTAAIGEVVDEKLKVKGINGLYVCDGSVFPVAPGLPPILTIVALAKWLSREIVH